MPHYQLLKLDKYQQVLKCREKSIDLSLIPKFVALFMHIFCVCVNNVLKYIGTNLCIGSSVFLSFVHYTYNDTICLYSISD